MYDTQPNSTSLASAAAYKKIKTTQPSDADTTPGGGNKPGDPPNYTKTSDPDVHMGKYGVPINRTEYTAAQADPKNNMKFNTFEDYANWVGGWARKSGDTPPSQTPAVQGKAPISPGYKIGGEQGSGVVIPGHNQQTSPSVPTQKKSNNY